MLRGQHGCVDLDAEDIRLHGGLNLGINFLHIAHAATQHDAIWVQQIDHLRQGASQPVHISLERGCCRRITLPHGLDDFNRAALCAIDAGMVMGEAGSAEPSF